MRTIYQVTFDITRLLEGLRARSTPPVSEKEYGPAQFAKEFAMRTEHVQRLQNDTWQEISRSELFKLFAIEQFLQRLLVIQRHHKKVRSL